MLCFGRREESDGLRAAYDLPLIRTGARRSNKSPKYVFLQYLKMTNSMHVLDETLWCVCLEESTDHEVKYSLRNVPTF